MDFAFPDRIQIARLPTPIQELPRLSERLGGPDLYVKRDDLTGMAVSGNKVRKLEFVAARALAEGREVLITCGGLGSNHARATAAVAACLGLKCHLVLAGDPPDLPQGNLFLDLLLGAQITYAPGSDLDDLYVEMERLAAEYAESGSKALIVPLGASDATGALGYAFAVGEMTRQFEQMDVTPDAIIVGCGSGGTQAGLMIGKERFGLASRIVGINVRQDEAYFRREITRILGEFRDLYGVGVQATERDIHLLDGHVGAGYGQSQPDELRFIAQVARSEGLLLDATYTGKALYGLCHEIEKGTFKPGEKILFIHTGGVFSLLPQGADFAEHVFETSGITN